MLLGAGITMIAFGVRGGGGRRAAREGDGVTALTGPPADGGADAGQAAPPYPLRLEGASTPGSAAGCGWSSGCWPSPTTSSWCSSGSPSSWSPWSRSSRSSSPAATRAGSSTSTSASLRWSWRVAFYSYSALGDRPLPAVQRWAATDYPATLEVDYPEQLSRGLVLVKWWLLAIPQYIVVGDHRLGPVVVGRLGRPGGVGALGLGHRLGRRPDRRAGAVRRGRGCCSPAATRGTSSTW